LVAIEREDARIVELLLDAGADPKSPIVNRKGFTAIEMAEACGTVEILDILVRFALRYFDADSMAIIDFLLEIGADVNTPLVPTKTSQPALHTAVEGENLDLIRRLIDRGADVNAAGDQYGTPIRIAAGSGNIEIAHLLIESGANVNGDGSETEGGFTTALENAAAEGRLDMVQLLINAGADTHLPGSKRYRRAEFYARRNGCIAVANF
ncbi:ankyrin, partial [Stipitochalara longipes BDJ]